MTELDRIALPGTGYVMMFGLQSESTMPKNFTMSITNIDEKKSLCTVNSINC
jgi:hypothetical protein